jgi:outer membrane protein assembly factor BamB
MQAKPIWSSTVVVLLLLLASPASAGEAEDLFTAARAGDLAAVRELIESGLAVDSADKYGATALGMAAGRGYLEVVRYLVEAGADLDRAEDFYGASPLGMALFNGHPEVAKVLLAAGAEGREQVLQFAISEADVELATAAVESGPLTESTLEGLRARAQSLDEPLRALLERAESRPDPEPPVYTAAELEPFLGSYEGFASDTRVVVTADGDRLLLAINERDPVVATPTGAQAFATEAGVQAAFFGRAGTVEGIQVLQEGAGPERLRRSVAEPLGAAAFKGATAAAPEVSESTVNWPAFRGANAAGSGDGVDAPVEWNVGTGQSVRWQAEIPGLGNSSPVVWGDRVFVTTAVAEGAEQAIRTGLTGAGESVDEEVEHHWVVIALDKGTGEKLWETEVGRAVPLTKRHFKATQANSTPVTDGRHVVVVFPTAGLACLDVDGKLLWKHELGGLNAGAFTDPGIEWGFASSPVIYGSQVILQVDVHGGQYIAAWNLKDGTEAWRTERDVAPSWATPNVVAGPEGDELVVNGSTIHGYDPTTGKELWSLGPNSELVIATPVYGQGLVYVSAGYPPVKPIYAFEPGLRGDHQVDPRAGDAKLAWSHGIGGAYMPTPLLYRGLLYVVHHNGRIVAYDAGSGAAIYKSRFSKGGTFTGSPVAVNGKLYMGTEEGLLYVLEAGPEYRELAINDMNEPLMATPAVSEGVLFLRTPSKLVAVARDDSEEAAASR